MYQLVPECDPDYNLIWKTHGKKILFREIHISKQLYQLAIKPIAIKSITLLISKTILKVEL